MMNGKDVRTASKIIRAASAALAAFTLLSAAQLRAAAADTYVLPLFETSDTHGYLADTSGDEYEYRLAYISDKVKDVRGYGDSYRKDLAILLDGGDIFQGNSLSSLLQGSSISAAYEIMDYDAVTVGNHEFDWGIENTVDRDGTMIDYFVEGESFVNDVPVVCSNLYENGSRAEFTRDYVILEKTAVSAGKELPVKVAVVGFASDYASSIMYSKFTGAGFSVKEDFAALESLAERLEQSGEADVTVLLTHGEAGEAAAALRGGSAIDLVLGGHTHRNENGVASSGVRYIQPACNGCAYAYAELRFTENGGKASFSGVSSADTVSIDAVRSRLYNNEKNADLLDRDVVMLSDMFIREISEALNTRIGYINTEARRYKFIAGSGERACTMGNWLASVTARAVGADVGFINSGGLRLDLELRVYDDVRFITASDVYAMFPFENRIYCYELTYTEFLHALEYSLTSSGSTLLSRMVGADCWFTDNTVNAIIIDGAAVYRNGVWQTGAEDKKIRVAVSEYIATSDRPDGDFSNPFYLWRDSGKVVSADTVDAEGALAVLREEAAQSGGLLYIDKTAHYINSEYAGSSASGAGWELSGGVLTVGGTALFSGRPWKEYTDEIITVVFTNFPPFVPKGSFDGCPLKKVSFPGTAEQWYSLKIEDKTLRQGTGITVCCTDGDIKASSYLCRAENEHQLKSIVVKKPTPEEDGVRQIYCERCGYTEYEPLPYSEYKEENTKKTLIIIAAAVAGVLLIAVAAVVVCIVVKRKKKARAPESTSGEGETYETENDG